MNPKMMTKTLILKRLVEAIPTDKVEKNLPAMEKLASRITDDVEEFLLPILAVGLADSSSIAPRQRGVRGLAG